MTTRSSRILALAVTALLLSAGALQAEPHSKPISDRVIVWELSLPNGQFVKHAAREGTMLKVSDSAEGWYYGFTPVIGENGEVEFTVFEITEVSPGQHALRQVDRSNAEIGSKRQTITVRGLAIEVKEVTDSKAFGRRECAPQRATGQLGENVLGTKEGTEVDDGVTAQGCCVTCGSFTVCNCAVEMGCGHCCSDPCCDPPAI